EEERALALSDAARSEQQRADAVDLDHHAVALLARGEEPIERLVDPRDRRARLQLRDAEGGAGARGRLLDDRERRDAAGDDHAAQPESEERVDARSLDVGLERLEIADL